MIAYLAGQYFINALAFITSLLMIQLFSGVESGHLLTRAIFWGGFFGGIYTFFIFKKNHIWPLYDNLRYPKYLLLFLFFLLLQILNFSIISLV